MERTNDSEFHKDLTDKVIPKNKVAENDAKKEEAEKDQDKFTKEDMAQYQEVLDFLHEAIDAGDLSTNKDKNAILQKLMDYSAILDRAVTEYLKTLEPNIELQLDGTFRDPSKENFNYVNNLRRVYTVHDPKNIHELSSPIGYIGVDTPFFERLVRKIVEENYRSRLPQIGLDKQFSVTNVPQDKKYLPNVKALDRIAVRTNGKETLLTEEELEKDRHSR